MKTHLEEKVPIEFNNYLKGVDQILKSAWEIANNNTLKNDNNSNGNGNNNNNNTSLVTTTTDERLRLQALQLANECYKHKIDLVTNGVLITDAIKFVQMKKEELSIDSISERKHNENDDKIKAKSIIDIYILVRE